MCFVPVFSSSCVSSLACPSLQCWYLSCSMPCSSSAVSTPLHQCCLVHSKLYALLAGEYGHLQEMAFYMIGDIDEAVTKADEIAMGTAN